MTNNQKPRWRILLAVALIWAVGLLAYANNYENGWHFDDQSYIVQNATIRSLDNFSEMWHNLSAPARVVVLYSFALNWHFGQDDVLGYHIVNNLIHVITASLVFGIVWLLLDTPAMRGATVARRRWWVALFAGLIFVSHPLQTQAVTYICQRFASMATLFYAAGLFFYVRARLRPGRAWIFFSLAGLTAVLGMFSKQIVITLPVAALLVEGLFFRSFATPDGGRFRVPWKVLVPVAAFLLIIPALYSFRVGGILSIKHKSSGSYRGELINKQTYPLTQLRVIPTYMRLLVLPVGQNLLYDFRVSRSLTEPKTLAGLLLILMCIGLGVACRRRYPLLAFGIFWFFLTVSVESSFIPIRHVIFEHRVYLPSIGFAILVAGLVFEFVRRPRQAAAILSVVVITLGALTWERNKVWRDELTLWEDVKVKSPHKMRPYLNTGIAHSERGNFEQAIADFQIALEKVPNSIMALNNLGVTYTKMRRYDEALAAYDKALAINPKWVEVWNNRGDVYRHRKQYAEALENYNRALQINDRMFRTLSNRGVVLAHLGREEEALDDFHQSLQIAPGFIEAHQNRGNLLGRMRRYEEAIADFTVVIAATPNVPEIYNNRGNAYRRMKRYEEALADYDRAIALRPQFAEAYNNRGVVYRQLKQYEPALRDFNTAIGLRPDYVSAYNNRGNLHKGEGRFKAALEDFGTALKYEPENQYVYFNRAKTHVSQRNFEAALRDAEIARHLGYAQAAPFIRNIKKVMHARP